MAFTFYKTRHDGAPATFVATAAATLAAGDLCVAKTDGSTWTPAASNVVGPLAVAAYAVASGSTGLFYACDPLTMFRCPTAATNSKIGYTYQIVGSTTMGMGSTTWTSISHPIAQFVEQLSTTEGVVIIHFGRSSATNA